MLTLQHKFLLKGPWDLIGRPKAGSRAPRQESHVPPSPSACLSLAGVRCAGQGNSAGPCLPQENETVGYLHRPWLRKDSQRSPRSAPAQHRTPCLNTSHDRQLIT